MNLGEDYDVDDGDDDAGHADTSGRKSGMETRLESDCAKGPGYLRRKGFDQYDCMCVCAINLYKRVCSDLHIS